jgi:hypothetical protein
VKDRLLTFALALGALAAFYVLLAPRPSLPTQRATRPLSVEPGPNGYLALQRWLESSDVPVRSLRERYGHLPGCSAETPTGNLLITTVPHVYPIRDSEAQPLSAWIGCGNTLLVLAALSDSPEWSLGEGADPDIMQHMKIMTGLTFEAIVPAQIATEKMGATVDPLLAVRRLAEPKHTKLSPNGAHPLLDGVKSMLAVSEFPSAQWQAASDLAMLMELAGDHEAKVPALWLLPHGNGQIVVSAFGSLLTNKVLGEHDNARLLANLVQWSVGARGEVIIDDAHQGLVSFYDPDKFFGDSRLHRSLGWLLALWFVFVLGPRRLRAAIADWNPVDVTSFVRATGGFMARVLKPAAAGQRLFANFFNEIRNRLGLTPDGAPVWDWLAAQAALPVADLERLQQLHARMMERRRIDLSELYNLLARVRASLI